MVILLPRRRRRSSTFGFQMKFNKCFVLADPIGQREKWTAATLAFMDQADLLGYQLVFIVFRKNML